MKLIYEKIKNNIVWIIGIMIFSLIVIFLVCNFMSKTKMLYWWDNVGYWERSISLISNFKNSVVNGSKFLMNSILFNDYNSIAAIFPAILMAIFNKSRFVYVISITLFYLIPSLIGIVFLIKKSLPLKTSDSLKFFSVIISLMFILPGLIYLNYLGFADLGGLLLMLLIYYLYYLYQPKNTKKIIIKNLIIGILLILLFFYRRWYVYFSVSFLIINFIYELICIIIDKKEIKLKINKLILKYINICVPMLIIILLTIIIYISYYNHESYNNLYIYKLLFVDYSDKYSAYKYSLMTDIFNFFKFYGKTLIIIFVFCTIYLLFKKEYMKKTLCIFLQFSMCLSLFLSTQSHDVHHWLLYVVPIIYILILFISCMINSKKYYVIYILLIISLINFVSVFPSFNDFKIVEFLKNRQIIPSLKFEPKIRNDIEHIDIINSKIDELSENGTKKIYINCSSEIINDSLIYNFDRSMGYNYDYKDYLLWVSHVDKRDGVPYQINTADIVVVSNPDQLHLKNAHIDQEVISYVNDVFLKNKNIAHSFELIYEYNFSNINFYFYKKIKEIKQDDYDEFIIQGKQYIE